MRGVSWSQIEILDCIKYGILKIPNSTQRSLASKGRRRAEKLFEEYNNATSEDDSNWFGNAIMNAQTIKLTEEETAVIYQCRQKESMWETWGRFLTLLFGIFLLVDGLFIFSNLSKVNNGRIIINETERWLLIISNWAAFSILLAGVSYIVLAIRFWNGNPSRKLLLKLVDRITNQEKTSETSSS